MNVQVVHVFREGGKGRMSSLIHMFATDLSVLDRRIELRKCLSLMVEEVLCLCEMCSTSRPSKWSPTEWKRVD